MALNGKSTLPTDWLFRFVVVWICVMFSAGIIYFTVEWVSFRQGYLEPIVTAAWGAIASGGLGLLGWLSHRLSDNRP